MNAVLQWGLSLLQKTPQVMASPRIPGDDTGDTLQRNLLLAMLKKLQGGRLALFENGKVLIFGKLEDSDDINASINVHSQEAWHMVLARGLIGAAEAYIAGHWTSVDPTQVVRLLVRNREVLQGLNRNTVENSQKNIRSHDDLNNDFFQLFLDPAMMYSSAVFRHPAEALAEASVYKLDLVCQQLQLQPGDHLLEIGTGWGGMAIHAAKHYGCRVTTTTISQTQYDFAQTRIEQAGLGQRVTLLQQDYRELQGQYDKLVSIEMIEAVGADSQKTFFETCDRLLRPGGRALIQAITIREELYENHLRNTDFVRQYISPGGCLPTVTRMKQLTRQHTALELVSMTDITQDYARTLNHWRQRFLFNFKQAMALGFDLAFIRMWDFYFCYCEGGFLEGNIGTQQLLFCKADKE